MSTLRLIKNHKLGFSLIAILLCLFFAPLYFNIAELKAGRPQNKCDKHVTDPAHDPRAIPRPNDDLKIIRLTNSGEYVDRCELTNALYELNWDRPQPSFAAEVKPDAVRLPKLVLLYIHGWKHNADQSDTDLQHFKELVKSIRIREHGKRYVVGIYVGWNATAPLWGWLENITFWVKKNNADRIAQSSSVTNIFSAIGSIVNSDPNRQDQFIAIGHSFGARILFSATAQPLVSAVQQAHPGFPGGTYKNIFGLADAVILLNPAFEASHYSAINGFIRNDESFNDLQAPLMVTVASDADSATQKAFPVGQWLGLARTIRELHTLGNYEHFWTHTLKTGSCSETSKNSITEVFSTANLCLRRLPKMYPDNIDDFRRPSGSPHNPFIVASATKEIIKDHNDIWNPTFRDWLVELIAALQKLHRDQRQQS